MSSYDSLQRASNLLGKRFQTISHGGRFDAILPKPRVGLVLVGGPRNRSGAIARQTRDGLTAAFRSAVRYQAKAMRGL